MTKTKKTTNKTDTKSTQNNNFKLTWLENKVFELLITIPKKEVRQNYQKSLEVIASQIELPGFRKGKAPLKLVEEKAGKGQIYQEVTNQLIPVHYQKAVRQHGLRPIVNPKVSVVRMDEDKDWEIKVTSCETPEVKLGDYKKTVKGAVAKDNIWVPGKGNKEESQEKPDKNKKLSLIMEALTKEISFGLPAILLDAERDRMLSRLLAQLNKLGLTLEQYVQSNNKTVDGLRQEYQSLAERNLRVELILQAIGESEKLTVADEEVKTSLDQIKDTSIKERLNNPEQQAYLKLSLLRQKIVDFLLQI